MKTRKPGPAEGDRGFVLFAVLAVLLVLSGALTALATAAAGAARTTRAREAVHQARLAAFGATERALAQWPARGFPDPSLPGPQPVASGTLPAGLVWEATAERLGPRVVLIRGTGTVRRGETFAEWSVGRLIVLGCGCDLAGEAVAAVGGGVVEVPAGGVVNALDRAGLLVDSAVAAGPFAGTVSGSPAVDPTGYRGSGVGAYTALSERSVSGPVALGPALDADGRCDRAVPSNWGAEAPHPCAEFAPVVHATADLSITGGFGQGILLVDGDLRLERGAHFRGLVVALGDVTIEPGSMLEGSLLVHTPTARVRVEGSVRLVPERLEEVLATALDGRRLDPPSRRWIPMF